MAGSIPPERAEAIITRDLGLQPPLSVAGLRARAVQTLGEERVAQAWLFVTQARLTRRGDELANLASLTVGTDLLGLDWWARPVTSAYPRDWHPFSEQFRALGDTESAGSSDAVVRPAEVLAGRFGYSPQRPWSGSALGTLAGVIADDVAGPAADFVDLNWPGDHRIEFPPGVGPDEEIVLVFDPGGRIGGRTFIDEDGRQSVHVDLDSTWHSRPANTHWAVGVTWQGTIVRLPDEEPGAANDPWSGPLSDADLVVVEALQRWAATVGVPARLCEPPWTTREQVAAAWVEARDQFGPDAIEWPDVVGGHRLHFQQVTGAGDRRYRAQRVRASATRPGSRIAGRLQ